MIVALAKDNVYIRAASMFGLVFVTKFIYANERYSFYFTSTLSRFFGFFEFRRFVSIFNCFEKVFRQCVRVHGLLGLVHNVQQSGRQRRRRDFRADQNVFLYVETYSYYCLF